MIEHAKRFLRPLDVRRHNRTTILRLAAQYARPGAVVYDIGCGDKPFAPHIRSLGCDYIGVDIADGFYEDKPDLIGSATEVPAPDRAADIVISSQTIEHLQDPFAALGEAYRLLKPGGVLILSFPFLYPIHAAPFDFGRYTRFFIESAAKRLGYVILAEAPYAGYWRMNAMSFAIYAQGFDRGPLRVLRIVPFITALQQWFCVGMHNLEAATVKLVARKNVDAVQRSWPLNYVFALGKNSNAFVAAE